MPKDNRPLPILREFLLWIAALPVFCMAIGISILSFVFPLELEFRESNNWLHVLALKAGKSLYDHTQVAFINMNHGPMDPLLKATLSIAFPFLTPWNVTRIFVLFIPLSFFLFTFISLPKENRSATRAILYSLPAYLFLVTLSPFNLLVGRTDSTVIFLLLPLFYLVIRPNPVKRLGGLIIGILIMMVFLTNFRYVPLCGAASWIFILKAWLGFPDPRTRNKVLLAHFFGLALPLALVLAFVFSFDLGLFYRHSFGFFTAASGWGSAPTQAPDQLLSHLSTHFQRTLPLWLGVATLLSVLSLRFGVLKQSTEILLGWLPMAIGVFATSVLSLYLNERGGGFYYLTSFYFFLWAWILSRLIILPRFWKVWAPLIAVGMVPFLTWKNLVPDADLLWKTLPDATVFMNRLTRLNESTPIVSEQAYFYLRKYQGETIDSGDVVQKVSEGVYFGEAFNQRVHTFFENYSKAPPPVLLTNIVRSAALERALSENYTLITQSPPQYFFNYKSYSDLWARKDIAPKMKEEFLRP